MKSKLFALALAAAAVMAVGVGGVAAADGASPDTVQTADQPAEETEDAENESTKLTADESMSIDIDENQMRSNGEGVIVVSLEGNFSGFPASFDEPVEPPGKTTITTRSLPSIRHLLSVGFWMDRPSALTPV